MDKNEIFTRPTSRTLPVRSALSVSTAPRIEDQSFDSLQQVVDEVHRLRHDLEEVQNYLKH